MATEITWLGHSTFAIQTADHALLVDPFLTDSPTATASADEVAADFVLLTHGHFDHVGDTVAIAKRTDATVIANFEICEWLKSQGIAEDKVAALNLGGGELFAFGRVKMTIAHHTSSLPDGTYAGNPGGFLLTLADGKIYIAGDTALFLDMKLIGMAGVDLAILPIGDKFTMGPGDSVEAIKLVNPKRVVPCHYNTWPPIRQDAAAWADRVRSQTAAEPVVLEPGGNIAL